MVPLLSAPSKDAGSATYIKHSLDPFLIPGNGIEINTHPILGHSSSGVAGVTASFDHHESETTLFDNFDSRTNVCSADTSLLVVWANADHIYLAEKVFRMERHGSKPKDYSSRSAAIV